MDGNFKKGRKFEWNRPYDESNLFFVAQGEAQFHVLGEDFVARADSIVTIPKYTAFSVEILEDNTEVYDYGCTARLLDLLEDYDAMISRNPAMINDPKVKADLFARNECYLTYTNLIYSHCE